jgi:hypothetical protein
LHLTTSAIALLLVLTVRATPLLAATKEEINQEKSEIHI